ncbi:MAG: ABC transporter [Rhodospirillaceae bacterium]|nr:ABC transporter [Rhodospirillaceae bacterium]
MDSIEHCYKQGVKYLEILRGASLTVPAGTITALVGPSGTGKSTLLHIAGLLERPNSGRVYINGEDCTNCNDNERTLRRQTALGFVYQFHNLLPEFSAIENIILPQMISGIEKPIAQGRAKELLFDVGLKDRMLHLPSELSGGEQQRVAIARALANEPAVLLADEPTGNLDEETANYTLELLLEVVKNFKVSALVATHNMKLAERMDRIILIKEGLLIDV